MIRPVGSGRGALFLVVLGAAAGAVVLLRPRLVAPPAATSSAAPRVGTHPGAPAGEPPVVGAVPAATSQAPAAPSSSASSPIDPLAALPLPPHARLDPASATACPAGMALVDGDYCPAVSHTCESWVGDDPTARPEARPPRRCRSFRRQVVCEGEGVHLHVCVDRFEYPNLLGVRPAVMASYPDAARACAVEGKRLCDADEWTLACEGSKAAPYPQGFVRAPEACTIDRPRRAPDPAALARPADVSLEVERLDQRMAAGAGPGCASPHAVFDLTGNVAEWVHDRLGGPTATRRDTAIAGGTWETGPSTCRTLDSRNGPDFTSPLVGFRCCADARDGVPPRRDTGRSARRLLRP